MKFKYRSLRRHKDNYRNYKNAVKEIPELEENESTLLVSNRRISPRIGLVFPLCDICNKEKTPLLTS